MDVNGTRYHLLYGCEDWGGCLLENNDGTFTLADLWDDGHAALEWDCDSASLRLAREVPLFKRHNGNTPLDINARRGAGRDSYNNWYWIDLDEKRILSQAGGAFTSAEFWPSSGQAAPTPAPETGAFVACMPQPGTHVLRGLAVTTRNYLVVGDITAQGLQVFDLEGGGAPLLLRWPKEVDFSPWDLAATPDGGVLVLDRGHYTYWSLDANFRLRGEAPGGDDMPFQACDASVRNYQGRDKSGPYRNALPSAYHGYSLSAGSPPGPLFPVSIEPGPDCHALILESDPSLDYSTIYEYQGERQIAAYALAHAVEIMDPSVGEGIPEMFSVLGHDFAYIDDGGSAVQVPGCDCAGEVIVQQTGCISPGQPLYVAQPRHLIYVADHGGKQAFAFYMDREEMVLGDQRDFLPMRRWDGKALVASGGQVYYDFANADAINRVPTVRWVPLMTFAECHYVRLAVLTTRANFDPDVVSPPVPVVPGEPFDSNLPGCVWHRLMLDAQIPQGTAISIRARAADDYALLAQTSWSDQPDPYLRSGGAELPYYYPWKDLQDGQLLPDGTGTWELLFQEIQGRYLQLELTVQGTGHATPALRALRAWYPRFSYLDNYLPAVYREDPAASSFLDRWLANFEGLYTNLEDKIEHAAELFDPRTAPAESLNWLACWLGLVLDPLWDEPRRRLLIGHIDQLYRWRGTAQGIEIAVRLYIDKYVNDSLFDPRCLGDSPVRIVEHFFTRGVGTQAFDAPISEGANRGARQFVPLTSTVVQNNAHRFTVMLPDGLSKEDLAMVERIVKLEKPAHTEFNLARYWEAFQVGGARLGLDTRVGEGYRYSPAVLGDVYLSDNYLEPPYPFNLSNRVVLNRDNPGNLPAL